MKPIKFESFFAMANAFYKSIGVQAYERSDGKRRSYLMDVIFFINMVNMNFVLLTESLYVLLAFKNNRNFLEATMNLSYIGFVFVGDIKIWNIWYRKKNLTQIMRDLEAIYPKDAKLQQEFGVGSFLRRCNRITFGFATVHLILIWTYNFYPMVTYLLYDYLLNWRAVEPSLPYFLYVPWDWHGHWSYYALYVSQDFAGHTCMNGQIASDVMLCAAVTQVIMHYQYLGKRIRNYVANHKNAMEKGKGDLEFLAQLVEYHQKILHFSDAINEVFGISLLVAFLTSSFVMCFLGFQMTVGAAIDAKVMLFLFLFCSLVQVYMISNYAQELIIASESIGHAAYNHDWHEADIRYKKLLVLIIKRSQKPAVLKATTFLNISLGTMTDLMQLSYKFFALLRTMYSK